MIVAICGGPGFLVHEGHPNDLRVAHRYSVENASHVFDGSTATEDDAVIERIIITARGQAFVLSVVAVYEKLEFHISQGASKHFS